MGGPPLPRSETNEGVAKAKFLSKLGIGPEISDPMPNTLFTKLLLHPTSRFSNFSRCSTGHRQSTTIFYKKTLFKSTGHKS